MGQSVNNSIKNTLKEVVVACLKYCSIICLFLLRSKICCAHGSPIRRVRKNLWVQNLQKLFGNIY